MSFEYLGRGSAQQSAESTDWRSPQNQTEESLGAIVFGQHREQIKKTAPARTEQEEVDETPAKSKKGEELKAELDDLLDEIDIVLVDNAEEFVKSYVQKAASKPVELF